MKLVIFEEKTNFRKSIHSFWKYIQNEGNVTLSTFRIFGYVAVQTKTWKWFCAKFSTLQMPRR